MPVVTYKYTSISDPGNNWSLEDRIVDADETNYGYDTISKNSVGTFVIGTASECDGTNLGTITKVEMLQRLGSDSPSNVVGLMSALFGGTTEGVTYETDFSTDGVPTTYACDITSEASAPSTWSWSDIEDLDVQVKGENNSGSSDNSIRGYVMWVRVTYTEVADDGPKFLMGFNF